MERTTTATIEKTAVEQAPAHWWQVGPQAWKALIASGLGWMLDSMDVMLYSMILVNIMADLHMNKSIGGLLASLTLLSSAAGGILFGVLADRIGRTRSLLYSVLIYSVFTALSGFSQTVSQLALFRVLLGLGMGGEWVAGAALVTEAWPAEHRGKAMGFVQGCWAIGYAAASLITALVLPTFGWRAVFFVGILPALIIYAVRRTVKEPEIWTQRQVTGGRRGSWQTFAEIFHAPHLKWTVLGSALSLFAQFGYWGLFTWIPTYLGTSAAEGGAGLTVTKTALWVIIMQVGSWLGYVTFGFIADRIGRRWTFFLFFAGAAVLVPFYGLTHTASTLLLLGPFVAFFGSGYFSGFGAVLAELFPTAIRATGQGFTYNFGRGVSASAPFVVGTLAMTMGLGSAFFATALSFALAAITTLVFLPETKGKELV
ncbi:MAG TPA: MFS transporter [Alicyclobacillus sp.]|nr:MFS transporter [Alicyclobacillus sp.]